MTNDFGPIWNITAVVSACASLEAMPHDCWPVSLRDRIDDNIWRARAGRRARHDAFVLEACDPCGDAGYPIDGLMVSDFCMPVYYKPYAAERYNFA